MAHRTALRARLQATLAFAGGLILWYRIGSGLTISVAGIAGMLALLAWFSPRHYAPIQRWFDRLARTLVAIVSWVLLGFLYFGLFTPLHAFCALARRDSLHRRFDRGAVTYLKPLPSTTRGRFDRQF